MKKIDIKILTEKYLMSLKNSENNKNLLVYDEHEYIDTRCNYLITRKLLQQNKNKITRLGRSSIKVVLTGGVFDIIHPGHIYTLNAAKSLGDVLIVVVASDNKKNMKKIPLHNQEQRKKLVNSLNMVDHCIIGNKNNIFKTVLNVKPDIIALGYDQIHKEKLIANRCKMLKLKVNVIRLKSQYPNISSSTIENVYKKEIYGI